MTYDPFSQRQVGVAAQKIGFELDFVVKYRSIWNNDEENWRSQHNLADACVLYHPLGVNSLVW